MGEPVMQRLYAGLDDMGCGFEVRFPNLQMDNSSALRFKRASSCENLKRALGPKFGHSR
jgi:hypothetical protein